jgi:acyl-CoA synthetase (AMP-forming)/AMP-acid ligase II
LATAPELEHILRHSDAQVLIGVRRFLRHDYGEKLNAALPDLNSSKSGMLRLPQAPFLRSIWLDDASGCNWADSIESLFAIANEPSGADDKFIQAMEVQVTASDDAVIIYTSGSTALPKAVLHMHRSVAQHSQVLAEQFLIGPDSRMMPLLPLFWVGGLAMALEVLQAGGTLVYPSNPAMDAVIDALQRYRVNRINGWGPQLGTLRVAARARGIDVDSILGMGLQINTDGTPIPVERTANMFGMTESFGPHSCAPLNTMMPEHRRGYSGPAIGGIERRVVDLDSGEVLPTGRTGELQLRGTALMRGFYKVDPRQVFTPDGYYPTNDIVRIEEDGYLMFEARRGDMLKTRGSNVSRLEVEAALRALPEVDQTIVVGLPDRNDGQLIVAAVVPRLGSAPTEDSLREALRHNLSSFKVPRRIIFISPDEVEWTPSNKVKLSEMATLIARRIGHEWAPDDATSQSD